MLQVAVAVYLGAILAGASILGVMKFDADTKAGRPNKPHHLLPVIIAAAGILLVIIAAPA